MRKDEKIHRVYDLEDRLTLFSCLILEIEENLPDTRAGKYIGGQLLRSGTSPALNYGEAQAAESKKDFIHKMKVCLKELRETSICLKIIFQRKMLNSQELLNKGLKESGELIAIFTASIKTAESDDEQ